MTDKMSWGLKVAISIGACVTVAGLVLGGVVAYWTNICPPQWWAEEVGNQLEVIADDLHSIDERDNIWGTPTDLTPAFSDCDSHRRATVLFANTKLSTRDVYKKFAEKADEQGWSLLEGQPWWGCRNKSITGMNAYLDLSGSRSEGSYWLGGEIVDTCSGIISRSDEPPV